MDKRAERDGTISEFLPTAGWGGDTRTDLAGDASFRRYWRLTDGARCPVLLGARPGLFDSGNLALSAVVGAAPVRSRPPTWCARCRQRRRY